MKLKTKFYLICIFLCEFFSINAENIFEKADSLYNIKNYQFAAIEYERIYFENFENDSVKYNACLKKAETLMLMNDFSKARICIDRVSLAQLPDKFKPIFAYQSAFYAFLNDNINEAESKIYIAKHIASKDTSLLLYIYFLESNIKSHVGKYNESKESILQLIEIKHFKQNTSDSLKSIVNNYFKKKNTPNIKSEKIARAWSTFLPGSGQLYAGAFWNGVFSGGLQFSSLAGAAYLFYKQYYITGFSMGLGLFQAFYFGGIRNASRLVIKNNQKKQIIFNQKINNLTTYILNYPN